LSHVAQIRNEHDRVYRFSRRLRIYRYLLALLKGYTFFKKEVEQGRASKATGIPMGESDFKDAVSKNKKAA
jgi:hypothetical protein